MAEHLDGPRFTKDKAVYLFSVPSGYYKIGVAANPDARRADLQCGNHERITFVGATLIGDEGADPFDMERRAHALLAQNRVGGEWFQAPFDDVVAAFGQAWRSAASQVPIVASSSNERVAKWRAANRETYNAKQREYMRRRRQAKG